MDVRLPSIAVIVVAAGCADPCRDDGLFQDNPGNCPVVGGFGSESTGSESGTGTGSSSDASTEGQTGSGDGTGSSSADESESAEGSTDPTADGSSTSTGPVGSSTWCVDADGDGFGSPDPDDCVEIPDDETPPNGTVQNGDDCNDDDVTTFPGAAPHDDPAACMQDADDDDWGSPTPPTGAVAGTDCNDATAEVQNVCLHVDLGGACVDVPDGSGAALAAVASGGSGNYVYSWSPTSDLDDPTIATPMATPQGIATYTVTVDDGFSQVSDSIVVTPNRALRFDTDCTLFTANLGAGEPAPVIAYSNGGTRACETQNGDVALHLCDPVYANTRIEGVFRVNNVGGDNDNIGFVWGAQDSSTFYHLTWKRQDQLQLFNEVCPNAFLNLWPAGILVKRVEAPAFAQITTEELFCAIDTDFSTVLVAPGDVTNQGWAFGTDYAVTIDFTDLGTQIVITRVADATVIADFAINDTTFTSGRFGTLTFSQAGACHGPWNAACL